jgi:hypothetical protein
MKKMVYDLKPIRIARIKGFNFNPTMNDKKIGDSYSGRISVSDTFNFKPLNIKPISTGSWKTPLNTNPIRLRPLIDTHGLRGIDIFAKRDAYPSKRDLTYHEAYHFFKLEPYGDIDRDGTPNWKDCRPYNPRMQGERWESFKEKVGSKLGFGEKDESPTPVYEVGDFTGTSGGQEPDASVSFETENYPPLEKPVEYTFSDRQEQQPQTEQSTQTEQPPQSEFINEMYDEQEPTGEAPQTEPEYPQPNPEQFVGPDAEFIQPEVQEVVIDNQEPEPVEEKKKKTLKERMFGPSKESTFDDNANWNVYVRFHNQNWRQYTDSVPKNEAMGIVSQLRSTRGVLDATASAEDILSQLNRQVVKENFMGAVQNRWSNKSGTKGWGPNLSRALGEKNITKKDIALMRGFASGPKGTKAMKSYIKSLDVRQGEPQYKPFASYRPRSSEEKNRPFPVFPFTNMGMSTQLKRQGGQQNNTQKSMFTPPQPFAVRRQNQIPNTQNQMPNQNEQMQPQGQAQRGDWWSFTKSKSGQRGIVMRKPTRRVGLSIRS